MRVFIESAGFAVEHDYRFLEVSPEGITAQTPPEAFLKATSRDERLFLLQEGGVLGLVLNDLPAAERVDFCKRGLRNSLVVLADTNEERAIPLDLCAYFLLHEQAFMSALDCAVQSTDEEEAGFEIDVSALRRLLLASAGMARQSEKPNLDEQLYSDSIHNRQLVAHELSCIVHEKKNRLWVLLCERADSENLRAWRPWRAIAKSGVEAFAREKANKEAQRQQKQEEQRRKQAGAVRAAGSFARVHKRGLAVGMAALITAAAAVFVLTLCLRERD